MTACPDWLEADHRLLADATRAAGALAMEFFESGDLTTWEKWPGHPVSDADIAVDRLLKEALREERPNYGWLSEESEDDLSRLATERQWVVDPIDGTRAFLAGRREFCVATALVSDGRPLAAVIFNPATDEFFESVRGKGVWLNQKRLRVRDASSPQQIRVLSGRNEIRRAVWATHVDGVEVTPVSSMAYKLALVASGKFDAAVTLWDKHDWDVVAGDLMIREAGGLVTTREGETLHYNLKEPRHRSVVAAGRILHDKLLQRLAAPL